MIGRKSVLGLRFSVFELLTEAVPRLPKTEGQSPKAKNQKGFSLLELIIAMFIMIILLSIAVPTYERSVRNAKEIVLKENLFQIRRAIDQFAGDKGKLPASVDDLVTEKYLREKPIDPITETAEWDEIMGEDPNSADGEQGLVNVKSLAQGEDVNGVSLSEY